MALAPVVQAALNHNFGVRIVMLSATLTPAAAAAAAWFR
jgi:hypothetical protein